MKSDRTRTDNRFAVKVWGDRACFSIPECNPEKFSYRMMTPSAAKGLLEAIFWKPEMRWTVRAIDMLNPVQWGHMTTNGVSSKLSTRGGVDPIDATKARSQFHCAFLTDVAYVIHADISVTSRATDPVTKYIQQAEKYIDRGANFQAPFLGLREFGADFAMATGDEVPFDDSFVINSMVHSLDWIPPEERTDGHESSGTRFFRAVVEHGTMVVPDLAGSVVR